MPRPVLVARMIVDAVMATLFAFIGVGGFTVGIQEWPFPKNLLSAALCLLCLLIAAGLLLDLAQTKRLGKRLSH